MISTSVSVGDGPKKQYAGSWQINSCLCELVLGNVRKDIILILGRQGIPSSLQDIYIPHGWHCITIWECELKPKVRELTLKSLAFTLNKIWLDDHAVKKRYPHLDDEGMLIAAEDLI